MIERIGIVGAGTMGAGIMINGVTSGLEVTMVDRNPEVLAKAVSKLERYLARQVQKERIAEKDVPVIAARLKTATDVSALGHVDLVIEAVFENLELKKSIFRDLEANVSANTILATNTSCLRLADIAEVLDHPERFCGMHYFSPAEINPVVELIEGPSTSQEVLKAAAGYLSHTKKEVIACKDQNGFALNRFFCPYTNEAVHVLDEGLATTGQIDEIAKQTFGLALGPFAVMNIIGTATNLNAVRNLEALGPYYQVARGLAVQGEDNTPWIIEEVPATLDSVIAEQIKQRLKNSVLLTVSEELAEGTATLEAIDKGATMAFRFGVTPGQLLEGARSGGHGAQLIAFAQERGHPVEKLKF